MRKYGACFFYKAGYGLAGAFVLELTNFTEPGFSAAQLRTWLPNLVGSFQLEGVVFGSARQAYLSTEGNSLGGAVLYRLDMDMNTFSAEPVAQTAIRIFPQPASDVLMIVCPVPFTAYLLDAQGQLVHHQQTAAMDLRKLPLNPPNT
ncbi:MAG: hypothetical protein DA408_10145 [Bacteroidetes bacterium]|nr:MAG: hypothetical protein C7N36_02605 [Bacteroidota bacterium]PTM12531.1 MAG: hypothetical protein DA408_10145 [Bacteroidota bacterium]